ncbi:MAG: aryl-sulfate sulfotransferase [Candidatus Thorarchaeota archaeon]
MNYFIVVHDADRKSNGNTLITVTDFTEMISHTDRINKQQNIGPNNLSSKIVEVNSQGNLIWQYIGLGIPHEVLELPNGHLLITDTQNDRIIEIDYPNKNIVWKWQPSLINWTKINPEWDENHYYNNPINLAGEFSYDWTHINDIDFKDYGLWNACLISIRNFDLIVEVNYTADFIEPNNPNNIVWYFGDYKNHTLINMQHNPDYLENGNVIISDSGNNRIVEVNYSTKEIIWIYDNGLMWPRDADELGNGNLLITDSIGCRIIEIDKQTKDIIWSYTSDLLIPYEADILDNGNILICNEYHGLIIEVNRNGEMVWRFGFSYIKAFIVLNSIFTIIISSFIIYYDYKLLKKARKRKIWKSIIFGLFSAILSFSVVLIFRSGDLISGIVHTVYSLSPDIF